jgi:hypothetical protein
VDSDNVVCLFYAGSGDTFNALHRFSTNIRGNLLHFYPWQGLTRLLTYPDVNIIANLLQILKVKISCLPFQNKIKTEKCY